MHQLARRWPSVRMPLSWAIVLPLVLGLVAAVALAGWLSLHHSQQMMTKTIAHLSEDFARSRRTRLSKLSRSASFKILDNAAP